MVKKHALLCRCRDGRYGSSFRARCARPLSECATLCCTKLATLRCGWFMESTTVMDAFGGPLCTEPMPSSLIYHPSRCVTLTPSIPASLTVALAASPPSIGIPNLSTFKRRSVILLSKFSDSMDLLKAFH